MAAAMARQTGADDVAIDNAHTVGNFQTILTRAFDFVHDMRAEKEGEMQNMEQQSAQIRVELRMAAVGQQLVPLPGQV